jgi:small subunit ribosomal protein S3Ae
MAIKKDWYQITAPEMFNNKVIAETPAYDPKQLKGRVVETSLIDLNQDVMKFYIKLRFKITDVDGNQAKTEFIGHDIMRDQIYRMVFKRKSRVDSINNITTADEKQVTLKTILTLSRKVKTTVKKAARAEMSAAIEDYCKNKTLDKIVDSIIRGELTKNVRQRVGKVYPVSSIEIRKSKVKN